MRRVLGDAVDEGVDLVELGVVFRTPHLHVGEQAVVPPAGQIGHEFTECGQALEPARTAHRMPVRLRPVREAKKLDAVAGTLQQGQHLLQLGDGLAGLRQRLMPELDHQIAHGNALVGHVQRNPVVRQAGPAQHQMARLKRADPVPHKRLAGARG